MPPRAPASAPPGSACPPTTTSWPCELGSAADVDVEAWNTVPPCAACSEGGEPGPPARARPRPVRRQPLPGRASRLPRRPPRACCAGGWGQDPEQQKQRLRGRRLIGSRWHRHPPYRPRVSGTEPPRSSRSCGRCRRARRFRPALQDRLTPARAHRRTSAQAAGPIADARRHRAHGRRGPARRPVERVRADQRGRLRLLDAGDRPVPRQRLPRAWFGRAGLPPGLRRRHRARGPRAAAGASRAGARAAWSGARHRPDGLGQDHDARRHDRPHQQQPRGSRRHHRGPDRGSALRQAVDDQPARGQARHRRLRHRPTRRHAARPDVILVGEMRDHETVKAALAAAETGHFVMSTLHTTDARRRSTASSTSSRRTSRSRSG